MSSHFKYKAHFSYCCILLKLSHSWGTFEPVRGKFEHWKFSSAKWTLLHSKLY